MSREENEFSARLFFPYILGKSTSFTYDTWLLRFCVSVSWRVLHFYREKHSLKGYHSDSIRRVNEAEEIWRDFLLGRRSDVGSFHQYLFPLAPLTTLPIPKEHIAPIINRYLLRADAMDLTHDTDFTFAYSKLSRFVIFGFIQEKNASQLQDHKVQLNGLIETHRCTLPFDVFSYLNKKAHREIALWKNLSPRQAEKIDSDLFSNLETYVGSDAHAALQHDIGLFGEAAFTRQHSVEDPH